MTDLIQIVETLLQKNISLYSIMQNIETSTPMGKFAFQMMASIVEMENRMQEEGGDWLA